MEEGNFNPQRDTRAWRAARCDPENLKGTGLIWRVGGDLPFEAPFFRAGGLRGPEETPFEMGGTATVRLHFPFFWRKPLFGALFSSRGREGQNLRLSRVFFFWAHSRQGEDFFPEGTPRALTKIWRHQEEWGRRRRGNRDAKGENRIFFQGPFLQDGASGGFFSGGVEKRVGPKGPQGDALFFREGTWKNNRWGAGGRGRGVFFGEALWGGGNRERGGEVFLSLNLNLSYYSIYIIINLIEL